MVVFVACTCAKNAQVVDKWLLQKMQQLREVKMARLIDADALIEEIGKEIDEAKKAPLCDYCAGMKNVIGIATNQDSVDPVKHGHWIYVGAHNGVHLFECSLCHCGLNTENPDWLSKYCSGCGAKMDGQYHD